jgi:hypothetical protein
MSTAQITVADRLLQLLPWLGEGAGLAKLIIMRWHTTVCARRAQCACCAAGQHHWRLKRLLEEGWRLHQRRLFVAAAAQACCSAAAVACLLVARVELAASNALAVEWCKFVAVSVVTGHLSASSTCV